MFWEVEAESADQISALTAVQYNDAVMRYIGWTVEEADGEADHLRLENA